MREEKKEKKKTKKPRPKEQSCIRLCLIANCKYNSDGSALHVVLLSIHAIKMWEVSLRNRDKLLHKAVFSPCHI